MDEPFLLMLLIVVTLIILGYGLTAFIKLFDKSADMTVEEDNKFYSPFEIVADIVSKMTEKDISDWASASDGDFSLSHHGTGRNIRNYYKMWSAENPYFYKSSYIEKQGPIGKIVNDPLHPDNASGTIRELIRLECKARMNAKNDI